MKASKDNNTKTEAVPQSCPYYNDFNELLGERVLSKYKNTNLPTSHEGKVHIFGKKVSTSLGDLVALKCSSCGFYKSL